MRLPGASAVSPVTSVVRLGQLGEGALPTCGRAPPRERPARTFGAARGTRTARGSPSARAIGSSGAASRPVRPSCTSSSAPPAAAAAAGSPDAAASRITCPKVSVVLGKQKASALAYSVGELVPVQLAEEGRRRAAPAPRRRRGLAPRRPARDARPAWRCGAAQTPRAAPRSASRSTGGRRRAAARCRRRAAARAAPRRGALGREPLGVDAAAPDARGHPLLRQRIGHRRGRAEHERALAVEPVDVAVESVGDEQIARQVQRIRAELGVVRADQRQPERLGRRKTAETDRARASRRGSPRAARARRRPAPASATARACRAPRSREPGTTSRAGTRRGPAARRAPRR